MLANGSADIFLNGWVDTPAVWWSVGWPMGWQKVLPKHCEKSCHRIRTCWQIRLADTVPKYNNPWASRHTANMMASWPSHRMETCLAKQTANMMATGLVSTLPNVCSMGQLTHCQCVAKWVGRPIANMLACLQMVSRQVTNILTNGFTYTTKQSMGHQINANKLPMGCQTVPAFRPTGWQREFQHNAQWVCSKPTNTLANGLADRPHGSAERLPILADWKEI